MDLIDKCKTIDLNIDYLNINWKKKFIQNFIDNSVYDEDFILNYLIQYFENEIDWNKLSFYIKLPENFIEKHKNKLNWEKICNYQELSEKFIEKHDNLVVWHMIFLNQKLSKKFIEKYKNKDNINLIYFNKKISNKTIRCLYGILNKDIVKLNCSYIKFRKKLLNEFRVIDKLFY